MRRERGREGKGEGGSCSWSRGSAHIRQRLAKCWPCVASAELSTSSGNLGRTRPWFGHFRSNSDHIRPEDAEPGPNLAKPGRHGDLRPKVCELASSSGKPGQKHGHGATRSGPNRVACSQHAANSAAFEALQSRDMPTEWGKRLRQRDSPRCPDLCRLSAEQSVRSTGAETPAPLQKFGEPAPRRHRTLLTTLRRTSPTASGQ